MKAEDGVDRNGRKDVEVVVDKGTQIHGRKGDGSKERNVEAKYVMERRGRRSMEPHKEDRNVWY